MCNPFEVIDTRLSAIEAMLQTVSSMLSSEYQSKNSITSHTLTVAEAAKLLKVSKSTIYSFVSRQIIPVSKRGKYLYFSEDELLAWLRAGKKQTVEEIRNEALLDIYRHHRKRSSNKI